MSNEIEVAISLANERVQFKGVSKSNPESPITFDYLPPLGDGQGFLGLELLVMSFAGCVSTGMVFLLRRMGKNISGFEMKATGIKRTKPLSLEKICLEVILESNNTEDSEIQTVIEQAKELSPVWIALKNNVEVSTEYKIIVP
jgi:putative redox protein